jgi:hypothetical protein
MTETPNGGGFRCRLESDATYLELKTSPAETHPARRPTAPAASARVPKYNGHVFLPGIPLSACTQQEGNYQNQNWHERKRVDSFAHAHRTTKNRLTLHT